MFKKYLSTLAFAFGFVCMLYYGKRLLIPLVLAVSVWYLINMLTDLFARVPFPLPYMRGRKLPRFLAFCASLFTIAAIIYFTSRIITSNITEVAAVAPAYQYNLERMSRRVLSFVPWNEPLSISNLITGVDFGSVARTLLRELTNVFGQGTIVSTYVLFLFMEQRSFMSKLVILFPAPARQAEVIGIIKRINSDVRKYIGIKTIASVVTALISYAIMSAVDLKFASFWAFLIFLLNYIPTVGSIVATALPTLFALMQYESLGPFLAVLIGVGIVQISIGNFIEPRFQGDNLNLSSLVIIISLALWNTIWGIPGMFLCVPMTAVAMIIFSHFPQTRPIAIALSLVGNLRDPVVPAGERETGKEQE
jgi:predicted PurR-regulated permease PerM